MKRSVILFGLGIASLGLVQFAATAGSLSQRPGSLDPAFGKRGFVIRPRAGAPAFAISVQPDAKVVVAGAGGAGFMVARYNKNGSLDRRFGAGGTATTNFGPGGDEAFAVTVQPNGKIVAAGSTNYGDAGRFALVRYRRNGSLDRSFGDDGKVVTAVGAGGAAVYALALRSDGKIVVAGTASDGTRANVALAQYNSDGSLDRAFGSNGIVMRDLCALQGEFDGAYAGGIVLQPDGKVVAAGGVDFGSFPGSDPCTSTGHLGAWFALTRYDGDGSPDQSFGTGGEVLTSFGRTPAQAWTIARTRDGELIAGGDAGAFALARYHANGSLDRRFGGDGKVTTSFGASDTAHLRGITIEPNGHVVGTGFVLTRDQHGLVALARYKSNGRRDRHFGRGGTVMTRIPGWRYAAGTAIALQPNGKIDVTGDVSTSDTLKTAWLLARYLSERPCTVPNVTDKTLRAARRSIRRASCALGKVRRASSRRVRSGRVISQRPRAHTTHPTGTKVNLVLSRGPRR